VIPELEAGPMVGIGCNANEFFSVGVQPQTSTEWLCLEVMHTAFGIRVLFIQPITSACLFCELYHARISGH
jgi:hypothetical protein